MAKLHSSAVLVSPRLVRNVVVCVTMGAAACVRVCVVCATHSVGQPSGIVLLCVLQCVAVCLAVCLAVLMSQESCVVFQCVLQ